jgi:hypothetical protein
MSAEFEERRFGGPDSGRWDLLIIAALFAALWLALQLAMMLKL